jgi:uncharacterized protein YutE (UPF0331/DUF86 family)
VTDADLIAKRLAFIETCIADLQRLAHPDRIADDVRERRFVEHTLQLAIQACLDVASHIVADERLGEANSNQELFSLLAANSWLSVASAAKLRQAAGLRNILVHGYTTVDPAIIRDVLEHHLGDLSEYVSAIRSGLQRSV